MCSDKYNNFTITESKLGATGAIPCLPRELAPLRLHGLNPWQKSAPNPRPFCSCFSWHNQAHNFGKFFRGNREVPQPLVLLCTLFSWSIQINFWSSRTSVFWHTEPECHPSCAFTMSSTSRSKENSYWLRFYYSWVPYSSDSHLSKYWTTFL